MRSRLGNRKRNVTIIAPLMILAALIAPQVASAAKWTIQSTPSLSKNGALKGVSCTSSTFCMAVGEYETGGGLRERWNGSEWTSQTGGAVFNDVSCVSSTFCIAVGGVTNPYAASWNGTEWKEQSLPNTFGTLFGISCTSASNCMAVGSSEGTALMMHWNGTAWERQLGTENGGAVLRGVSCTSSSFCMAVGYKTGTRKTTFAELWNGESEYWLARYPNNVGETTNNKLESISCTSTKECMTVGSAAGILAEKWEGGESWKVQTNPAGATKFEELGGVSCTSASACIATGYGAGSPAGSTPVAEGWTGAEWAFQTTVKPESDVEADLARVSCTSSTTCTAVGSWVDGSLKVKPLVERYQ